MVGPKRARCKNCIRLHRKCYHDGRCRVLQVGRPSSGVLSQSQCAKDRKWPSSMKELAIGNQGGECFMAILKTRDDDGKLICATPRPSKFDMDHLRPLCEGGCTYVNNGDALCCNCHRKRSDEEKKKHSQADSAGTNVSGNKHENSSAKHTVMI